MRRIAEIDFGYLPLIHGLTGIPNLAAYPFFPPSALIGTVILLTALCIIFCAHHDLGCGFSSSLEIRPNHPLVPVGTHRYIRPPMYLGFLLWAITQALLLPNWIVAAGGVVG